MKGSAGISRPRQALANVAAKGGSIAIERGAQLAIMLVAAPILGPAAFGRFAFAGSLGALLAFGTDLGLTIWTTRALARDPAIGGAVFRTALRLRLTAAVPVLLALAGIAWVVDDAGLAIAVLAVGLTMLIRLFLDQARAVFRAHERLADEARVNSVAAIAAAAGGIAGLLATRHDRLGGLAGLSVGMMAGTIAGAVYGFGLLRRRYGLGGGGGALVDRNALRVRMLRESFPFWLAGIFSLVYARADVLVLRGLASDAEVGAYRTAGQLVEVARQIPVMILTALFAQLARAFAEDRARFLRLERQVGALLLLSGLLAGLALAGLARPLVPRLFGADFARTIPALWVLAGAVPLLFSNAGMLHFFAARDRGKLNLLFSGAMVPINLVAHLILDRPFGAVGAAVATLVSEAFLSAGCLYTLRSLRRADVSAPRGG